MAPWMTQAVNAAVRAAKAAEELNKRSREALAACKPPPEQKLLDRMKKERDEALEKLAERVETIKKKNAEIADLRGQIPPLQAEINDLNKSLKKMEREKDAIITDLQEQVSRLTTKLEKKE